MTQEDYSRLAAWLSREEGASEPEDISASERTEAEKAWDMAGHYVYPCTDAGAWNRFNQQVAPVKRRNFTWTVLLGAGAAAATIAAVYFTFFYSPDKTAPGIAADAMVYYNSALGEQKTIVLPDESRVTLNAGSGLWVLPGYGDDSRNVELKGEAFFDVRPATAPFSVKTGNGSIAVLGTRFNAEAYGNQLVLQVAEGKVQLEAAGKALIVPAGRGGIVAYGKAPIATEGDSTAWAWKNGQLSFRNTPVPEVVAEIERFYGVQIGYPENLAQKRYTGTFDKLSCDKVLGILSAAMGGNFAIHGQE